MTSLVRSDHPRAVSLSGVNVDNEFIDNNGFLRYTFENVISIGYNVTGNVSIDLTLFEGLDPTRLQGIFIGEKRRLRA
ncbi:MAG: hypothetical protein ACLUSP_10520 [Christensenellales bacterium]